MSDWQPPDGAAPIDTDAASTWSPPDGAKPIVLASAETAPERATAAWTPPDGAKPVNVPAEAPVAPPAAPTEPAPPKLQLTGLHSSMDDWIKLANQPKPPPPDNGPQLEPSNFRAYEQQAEKDRLAAEMPGRNFRAMERKTEELRRVTEERDVVGAFDDLIKSKTDPLTKGGATGVLGTLFKQFNGVDTSINIVQGFDNYMKGLAGRDDPESKAAAAFYQNFRNNGLFGMVYDTAKEKNEIRDRLVDDGTVYEEKSRRAASGEPYDPAHMREWLDRRVHMEWAANKTPEQEMSFTGFLKAFGEAATKQPKETIKGIINGMAADFWSLPIEGAGIAKGMKSATVGQKVAKATVYAGDTMATQAALAVPSAAARQEREQGVVTASNVANEAGVAAGATSAMHMGPKVAMKAAALTGDAAKAVTRTIADALDIGGKAGAESKDATLTVENKAEMMGAVKERMESGMSPGEATASVLKDFGLKDAAVERIKTLVDEHVGEQFDEHLASTTLDDSVANIATENAREPLVMPDDLEAGDPSRIVMQSRLRKIAALLEREDKAGALAGVEQLLGQWDEKVETNAEKRNRDRVRGTDRVRSEIYDWMRTGELPRAEGEFGLWLLDKNPNIGNRLAISMRGNLGGASGRYHPGERLISLLRNMGDGGGGRTVAHELLHAVEQFLPPEVRAGIRAEWAKRLTRFEEWGHDNHVDPGLVGNIVQDIVLAQAGDHPASTRLETVINSGLVPREFYSLTSPSEFWTVNGSRILKDRQMAGKSWVKQAKQWMKELLEHTKGIAGLESDAPVLRALKETLQSDVRRHTGNMIQSNLGPFEPRRQYAARSGVLNAAGHEIRPSPENNRWGAADNRGGGGDEGVPADAMGRVVRGSSLSKQEWQIIQQHRATIANASGQPPSTSPRLSSAESKMIAALRKQTVGQTRENPARGRQEIFKLLDDEVAAGRLKKETVDLAKWFVGQNPKMLARLGLSMFDRVRGAAGFYSPLEHMIGIVRNPNAPTDVIVHEIEHGVERMMPPHLQRPIAREWDRRHKAESARAAAAGDTAIDLYMQLTRKAAEGNASARKSAMKMLEQGLVPIRTHYQYFDSSEFWTMNGAAMVEKWSQVAPGRAAAMKHWWAKTVEKLKNAAGKESDANIIRGLELALTTKGKFKSDKMLYEVAEHLIKNPSEMSKWARAADAFENTTPKVLAGAALGAGGLAAGALMGDDGKRTKKALEYAAVGAMAPFAAGAMRSFWKGYKYLSRRPEYAVKEPFNGIIGAHDAMVQNAASWAQGLRRDRPNRITSPKELAASNIRIRDYIQGARDVPLSPHELQVADAITQFNKDVGQLGLDEGVLRELRKDYLTGLYTKPPWTSWDDVVDFLDGKQTVQGAGGGGMPKTRFARAKVFDDYRQVQDAIESGSLNLVPLTDDPIRIAQVYATSIAKAIMTKRLIDELQRPQTGVHGASAIPLIFEQTPAKQAATIAHGNAIAQKDWTWPDATKQAQNNFMIRNAPADYVEFKHAAFEGMRVHKDIVPALRLLFDTSDPIITTRMAHAISMASKTAVFAASMFHAGALGTVALTTLVPRLALFAFKAPALWAAAPGARALLKSEALLPEFETSLRQGLKISTPEDVDAGMLGRMMKLTGFYLGEGAEKVGLPRSVGEFGPKMANELNHMFTHIMFGVIMPTLKLSTFMAEKQAAIVKDAARVAKEIKAGKPNPQLRSDDDIGREVADAVNTVYGGLNTFEIANNIDGKIARTFASHLFSPNGKRWQQIILMAPDWNLAALRAWTEGAKAINPLMPKKASDAMYRNYMLWSLLFTFGVGNYIQKKMTGVPLTENDDWSRVDLGNGTYMVLNKHAMEGLHLLQNPIAFGINKTNVLLREPLNQLLGRDYLTYNPYKEKLSERLSGPTMEEGGRLKHVASQFMPITGSTFMKDKWAWLSGFSGIPIHGTRTEAKVAEVRQVAEEKGLDPDQAEKKFRQGQLHFAEVAAKDRAAAAVRSRMGKPKTDEGKEALKEAIADAEAAAVERVRDRRERISAHRGEQ